MVKILLICVFSSLFIFKDRNCLEIKYLWAKKDSANLIVTNVTDHEVKIPEWLVHNQARNKHSELYLEFQKKNSHSEEFTEYEELQYKNVDYFLIRRKAITLSPKESYKYSIDLQLLHDIPRKGNYRFRVILRLKSYNDCDSLVSEWHPIEVN